MREREDIMWLSAFPLNDEANMAVMDSNDQICQFQMNELSEVIKPKIAN